MSKFSRTLTSYPSYTRKAKKKKTYNTRDSLVVTDPTTSLALRGLCLGERTGPSVFHELWSYVLVLSLEEAYNHLLARYMVIKRVYSRLRGVHFAIFNTSSTTPYPGREFEILSRSVNVL